MELAETTGHKAPAQPARVRVEMGHRVFVGDVRLIESDFRSRVSDLVNDPARRFLPLADVEMLDAGTGEILGRTPFLLLRLDAIDLLVPLKEPSERAPQK